MQPFIKSVRADSSCEAVGSPPDHRMTQAALESWLRLRAIDGVGDVMVLRLVRVWRSPEIVLNASRDELVQTVCSPQLADAIRRGPDSSAQRNIESQLNAIERRRVEVRNLLASNYPMRLKMVADPPPLLYITGTLTEED